MKVIIKKKKVVQESELLNELDFVGGFKNFLKSPVATSKNIAKGLYQIGLTGKETTILGGEEVFDIEKRNALRSQAESELLKVLQEIDDVIGSEVFTTIKDKLDAQNFPNQEKESGFIASVEEFKKTYNNIVNAHDAGKLPTQTANTFIAALRDIVIYYQDFKIADKYLYVSSDPKLFEAEEGAISKSYVTAYAKKLPLMAAGTGAALLGLGMFANSDQFLDLLQRLKGVTRVRDASRIVTDRLDIRDGEGITDAIQRITRIDLGSSQSVEVLKNPKIKILLTLAKGALQKQAGGGAAIDKILAGDFGGARTLGQLFSGNLEGTGKRVGDLLVVDKGNFENAITQVIEREVQNPGGVGVRFLELAGKLLGSAAAIKFAVALIGGGATMTALRMKGERSSRMATLKELVDSFKDVVAGKKQLATGEEQPKLAGRGEAPQLPAAATKAQLPGKEELPALKGKEAQPALPTQPRLSLPPAQEPEKKQGPERVIPLGPSSIEGKSVESLIADLQKKLDDSEQLKKLSSEDGEQGKKLEKAVSAMVKIAINDITQQLKDAGYEPGDEVTIAESKSIKLSFFDKFAGELTSKSRKVGGASVGMQTILSVVRNWAESAGFTVDATSLEKFGKKSGFPTKSDKTEPEVAAPRAEPAGKAATTVPEEPARVEPENVAVAKNPVDSGSVRKIFKTAKKVAGSKIRIKTSRNPKAVVITTEPPLSGSEKKAVKDAAKDVKAPPSKISSDEKSAVVVPAGPSDASRLKDSEKAADVVNKVSKEKSAPVSATSGKTDINSNSAFNKFQEIVNSFEEEGAISNDQLDTIIRKFRAMKTKNLENIVNLIDSSVRDRETKENMTNELTTWFNSMQESKLNESFEFRNRFMKLAGILRG
jgi:hypothetical protein